MPDEHVGFLEGYIGSALWSTPDIDRDGYMLDARFDADDLAPVTRERMAFDCRTFEAAHAVLLDAYYELTGRDACAAGHDFWLTRNGHGTGFWDRDAGEVGRKLTDAANGEGELLLYPGDDGTLYLG